MVKPIETQTQKIARLIKEHHATQGAAPFKKTPTTTPTKTPTKTPRKATAKLPANVKFRRQSVEVGGGTDMNITRDGVLIGTSSHKGFNPYIHTVVLNDGRNGAGTSKARAFAAAETSR